MKRRVLITGATGRAGTALIARIGGQYDLLLTDRREPATPTGVPFTRADINDLAAMRALCAGVDTVLHLAADPHPDAPWENLLPDNITGAYTVFQAASEAGCARLIFASTMMTVLGYPRDTIVTPEMPPRPTTLYATTKVWGEALAAFFAAQQTLSVICLRLGWIMDPRDPQVSPGHPALPWLLTYDDLARLMVAAIEAPPTLRYGLFHGISNDLDRHIDLSDTRTVLGYAPQDGAFARVREKPWRKWLRRVKRALRRAISHART